MTDVVQASPDGPHLDDESDGQVIAGDVPHVQELKEYGVLERPDLIIANESTGSPKLSMEDVMHTFLEEESQLTTGDYLKRFYQIRVEQEKFRGDPDFSCDSACSLMHYARNRYRDILPYDHNRVELKNGDENPDGYMNASFIKLPGVKTQFIAAQAPLPTTLDEWWQMIDEQNVFLVVILCKLVELNKVKCERYWPAEVNTSEMFGDYEITLEKVQAYEDDEYVLRTMKMHNQKTGEIRQIHQLHYREWPDHGCPTGEKQLLNMIDEMQTIYEEHQKADEPILVHCSAGVGRTGTIIAVNHIRELIKANALDSIDLFDLVMALRRQRSSMVQTQDQYQFVHKCVAAYCRRKLGLPEPPMPLKERPDPSPVNLIAPPTPTEPQLSGTGPTRTIVANSDADSCELSDSDDFLKTVPEYPMESPSPDGPEEMESAGA